MPWEIQLACVQLTDRHTHAYTLTNNRAGSEQGCTEFCDLWGFSHSLVVLQLPGATGFDLIKGICELGTGTGWEETCARKMQNKWNRMKTMKMIMTALLVHIVIPESTRIIIKIIMTMTMMMMIIIMTDEDDTD